MPSQIHAHLNNKIEVLHLTIYTYIFFSYVKVNQHFTDTAFRANDSLKHTVQDDIPAGRIYNDVSFIITNENFCHGPNFDILIYVFSGAANFAPRLAIRSTWGNKTVLKDVKLVYIIGRASSMDTHKLIEEESKKFNDIVQGDFEDSYYRLGNKSITSLNWIRMYCKTAKVFMKADDDLALDIKRIVKSVHPYINKPRHLMCRLLKFSPLIRNKKSKFYVSLDEYPGKSYPPYCNGWVYLYTADMVEEICRYMLQTEMFKIEDVWTTGMVMKNVQNLKRIQL